MITISLLQRQFLLDTSDSFDHSIYDDQFKLEMD